MKQLLDTKAGIAAELNLVQGSMSVKTTRKTWDPYVLFRARDLLKLVARGVPLPDAARMLEDEISCDIVKNTVLKLFYSHGLLHYQGRTADGFSWPVIRNDMLG